MKNKDLAIRCNTSTATISRYFTHPHKLSRKIRLKIESVLKEKPYQPNQIASQLAKKKKGKIAFIYPQNQDLFTYQRFQAIYYLLLTEINKIMFTLDVLAESEIEALAEHYDFKIFLDTNYKIKSTDNSINVLFQQQTNETSNYIVVEAPTVGNMLASLFCPASLLMPLVLLPSNYQLSSLSQVMTSLKEKLKSHQVFPNPHHFLEDCNSFESALDATSSAFALGLDFHSIIAFNQEAALGAIAAAKAEGLAYPYDIQIVHYGHPKEFYAVEHQITCLSDPLFLIIENVIKFIQGKNIKQTLTPILIEGQTY